jgi:lipoprotein-anchoring transpeptidase ErfK/SrfK
MSGGEGRKDYCFLADIPYIIYFDSLIGVAFHGTCGQDRFGYKHSHGCVNMPIKVAEWTFNWSAEAPNDLWVWVHPSDPALHLN